MKRLLIAIPAVTGLALGAGLASLGGGSTDHHHTLHGDEAYHYMIDQTAARLDAAEFYDFALRYSDYLPNQKFKLGSKRPYPLSTALVVGTIDSVRPVAGYKVEGKDSETGIVTAFDDSEAVWRDIDLSVRVEHGFGELAGAEVVHVGMTVDGSVDAQSFMNGLVDRRIAAPLAGQGFYKSDSSLWNISRSESLLGFISSDGHLEAPFIDDFVAAWRTPDTASELMDAAARKERAVITLERTDGLLVQP